jgi:hypothetical protein
MSRRAVIGCGRAILIGGGHLGAMLLALLAMLTPFVAQAHEGAPTSFASITIDGTRVLYSLTTSSQPLAGAASFGAQGAALADPGDAASPPDPARMATLIARHLRIEADGRRCLPGALDFVPPSPPRLSTTYNIAFTCDAPIGRLRITDDSFDFIGRGAHVLLRVSVQGREEPLAAALLLADEARSAELDVRPGGRLGAQDASEAGAGPPGTTSAGSAPGGPMEFLPLGIQHILEGWDHLLFLLVLVLPGGSLGNLVRIVTAFTLAHSLTLAAAALEWISVPAAPVEALIALSIAWVAAENLARARPMSRRWASAFAFGLIHGFGFSNVLRDIGLPRDALLSSLMWFNLGIELGQLLVVLLLVPTLAWLGRQRPGRQVPQVLSALILIVSVALLVERL